MVSADGTVEIGGRGVVEGADREVQYAVSRIAVLQDRPVGVRLRHLPAAGRGEVVRGEEPQVHGNEIRQYDGRQQGRERVFPDPAQGEERDGARREQDHQKRPPGIGAHHRGAVGSHRRAGGVAPFGVRAAGDVFLHVVRLEDAAELFGHHLRAFGAPEVEQRAAGHGQQQADASRDARRPGQCAQQAPARNVSAPEPCEGQCPEHRHGPLDDDQRHRDGAELVVSGQDAESQLRETHQIAAPGQQDHHRADGDDPPFVAASGEGDAQRGQEHRRRAQVGRAARIGLRAPVGG